MVLRGMAGMLKLIDEQLEDMEKTCNLYSITYNDPFRIAQTNRDIIRFTRAFLPDSD